MSSEHHAALQRIARSNVAAATGPGLDPQQMVPAFMIHHRIVAQQLEQVLRETPMQLEIRRSRLFTEFFVPAEDLQRALAISDEFLSVHPDMPLREFSRDYDSVILLLPVTVLVSIAIYFTPFYSPLILLAVWVSGISTMIIGEWTNRQYRLQQGKQLRLFEIFIVTTIVAANLALWRLAIMSVP